jgi:integrase
VWLQGATADPPLILNRSGEVYKPSVLRGYAADLRNYVLPELGGRRLADVRRADLQALVDRLVGRGLSASKVRNVLMPVRAIYRHALERDEVIVNPTANLRLPTELGIRDRVATVSEAEALFEALPEGDRALWATAFYAGLRLGELRALRWDDIDLAAGLIRIERSWDDKAGVVAPKSKKGRRHVPVMGALGAYLERHQALSRRSGRDLVFGWTASSPFTPSHMRRRALKAWAATALGAFFRAEPLPIELRPIGFHELRHSFVSFAAAAVGPNGERLKPEEIGDMVGHSAVYMTERYRHEFEGRTRSYGGVLDNYRLLTYGGTRKSSDVLQQQPLSEVKGPPPLLEAFARLFDEADPDQLIASRMQLRALLDVHIGLKQVSARDESRRR